MNNMFLDKDSYINNAYLEIKSLQGEIITSGKIIDSKNTIGEHFLKINTFLSVDNKYFFNLKSNNFISRISFEYLPNIFIKSNLIKDLKIINWTEFQSQKNIRKILNKADENRLLKECNSIDIFTEKTIDEADVEIKDFLYFLNTIPGVTTFSSCCGHKKKPMFILFGIEHNAIQVLQKMLFIIHKLNLENEVFIQLDYNHFPDNNYYTDKLLLEFRSKRKGNEKSWKALDKFKILWETLYE